MDKKLKLFVACCAIALTAVCSTTEVKAGAANYESTTTTISTSTSSMGGGCVGSGACGVTRKGTVLIGKWRE